MLNLDLAGSTGWMWSRCQQVNKNVERNPAAFQTCSDRSDMFWMNMCMPNLIEYSDRNNPKYIFPTLMWKLLAQVEIV